MISSLRNPKVAAAVRLKKRAFREAERAFLVEGAQAVGEALRTGAGLRTLFHTDLHPLVAEARERGVEVLEVSETVMARLTSTVTPQGLVGIAPFLDVELDALPEAPGSLAILHAVRDPGNAGTVLRSADAAGVDGVVFTETSVDVYNPKTVRATAGSLFHLPVVREAETSAAIELAKARGCRVLAMDANGEDDLYELDLSIPTAFVFGNEAWGLPPEVARLADATVRVPIAGRAESLNLAAAASVCLFEWARQRREGARAALETVIASAAHDIRSPLTAMKGFSETLERRWEQLSAEQRGIMLAGIVYDTDRLNMIVRQLVDAARVAAGSIDLFPDRVDVADVVARIAAVRARDPDHPEIRWEGERPTAFTDPDRLQMMLEAFVEAEAWWGSDGPILARATAAEGRLRVEVERGGVDLSPTDAEALFRPRVPGTGAGSKIGLFVARGVAEAEGGTADVSIADGVLRFVVDVPEAGAENGR
ncbi:MAG: TrmH family RNA methyltransferase [Actinomycetota bacterium]